MTLGLITKIWKRPELTRTFMEYYAQLSVPGVRFVCMAAVSPEEDPGVPDLTNWAWESGLDHIRYWHFVDAPNRPLSEKGNIACQALRGRVDAVLNVGSDDFCDEQYILSALKAIESHPYVAPNSIYFYDQPTGRCSRFENERLGAGRLFRADLLDSVDWTPFGTGERPDFDSEPVVGLPFTIPGEVVADVKTDVNIATYDALSGGKVDVDPAIVLDRFPILK